MKLDKYINNLGDKHFLEFIKSCCYEYENKKFEQFFQSSCKCIDENDEILNQTYKAISQAATNDIKTYINNYFKHLSITFENEQCMFRELLHDFIDEFLSRYDIERLVDDFIYDNYSDRLKSLQISGVINSEGQLINETNRNNTK